MERAVLGRGLRSLIPDKKEAGKGPKVVDISLALIVPNQNQPRLEFDSDALLQLTQSIKDKGVLQPILVRKGADENGYEIIAGERRFRACKNLGLMTVPAIVKEVNDLDSCEIALVENLQRSDLNWIEKAFAYKNYMDKFEMTQEDLGQKIGLSRTSVTNTLRLLSLPEDVRTKIASGEITFASAKLLMSLDSKDEQQQVAKELVDEKLSTKDLTKRIKKAKYGAKSEEDEKNQDLHVMALEEDLAETLGTKVSVKYTDSSQKGLISVEFYSLDDLQRLVSRIKEEGL
ncbi:hypothetical protein AB834_06960 [PVC group bacterium (ex Bugula neritina AB1)]|nr:hypothetical protein AB834_06960 [PVC group bacterium (ex Bugula neritina AB1)]